MTDASKPSGRTGQAAAATKASAKKAPAKKAPAKKTPVTKAPAKKTTAKKTTARKTTAKKTAAAKTAATARRGTAAAMRGTAARDRHSDPVEGDDTVGTPHRPSRRHLIVDAAIRVFASKGFSEASIQEIADEAGVVATAVYYHFAGKEELFEAALTRGLDASDAVIAAARPDDAHADASVFRSVIRASWDWAETSPDMARLLFLHMPGGATPVARTLARDYLERHARRAYDYFENTEIPTNRRRAAAEYAARTLTVRTIMGLTLSVHSLQMDGGPLSSVSSAKMVDATARLCERLFQRA